MAAKSSVALLISGGVDSTVACYELISQGYKPDLYYIAIGPEENFNGYDCKMEEDIDLCKLIAKRYELKFEVVPLHNEYWSMVVKYHVESLREGRTPNPDLLCNQLIKFGAFEEKIGYKYDYIATGHYASITKIGKEAYLSTAVDHTKDQTYFLAQLSRKQISKIMFPIGKYKKTELREIARREDFANAERKDSQGICFIARNHYDDFVNSLLGKKQGDFIDFRNGKKLGIHDGHWYFTIGQRKGLGLAGGPWFVVKKDINSNTVYLSNGYNPDEVYGDKIFVKNINFLTEKDYFENGQNITFKIRHTPTFTKGSIETTPDGIRINSSTKMHGIAPGQFAVIYDKDEKIVLASGEITIE